MLQALTLANLSLTKSQLETKINVNVFSHTSLWCLKKVSWMLKGLHKTFFEAPQSVKKNYVNFFPLVWDRDSKGYANLGKLINFYSPWNHQKTIGVFMTSWGNEVSEFAQIHLITEAKFGNDPK